MIEEPRWCVRSAASRRLGRWAIVLLCLGVAPAGAAAQDGKPTADVPVSPPRALPPLAIASPPRLPLAFNRLYDYPELTDALKGLVAAHPGLLSLRSLGRSV